MLSIEITNQLTEAQEKEIRALVRHMRLSDGLVREPYLSNSLNFDPEMPAFFLAYDEERLVAILTVYADDHEPEILLWVRPSHRRQGIAKKLVETYERETAAYGLENPAFTIEKHFLDRHPDLPNHWKLTLQEDLEYWMARDRKLLDFSMRPDLKVCQASMTHLEAIAQFQSQVFENPIEESRRYAKAGIEDATNLLYVVLKEETVIASCTVDISSGDNYLYGLAVRDDYQGQGIGTYMTQWILNDRIQNDEQQRPFQIAVEADNLGAKRLYERLGFKVASEIMFLK